jgi:hypothetical protein
MERTVPRQAAIRRANAVAAADRLIELAQRARIVAEAVRADTSAVLIRCRRTLDRKIRVP